MRKSLITVILALAGFLLANAQYTFTISGGFSGNCANVSGYKELNQQLLQIKGQAIGGFPDRASCEQVRAMINSIKSQAIMIIYDARTGRVIDKKNYNCSFSLSTSPCTGRPFGGSAGEPNILGVGQGSSFSSTNSTYEIQDWSSDDMERMLALNPEFVNYSSSDLSTGDIEADMARSNAREAAFVIDPSKPFRSLNVGEDGQINTHSDDFDTFTSIWQMESKQRKLPDADVFAYRDRMIDNANKMLEDLLKRSDFTREELEGKILEWNNILNNFLLAETVRYRTEKDIIEKALALAQYKVEYKAILNLKYVDAIDEDNHATESAFIIVNGMTREQMYKEELEQKEKALIELGLSEDDILRIKSQVERDAVVKDHVSTMSDVAEGVGKVNDFVLGNDIINQIISGIKEGATYGVLVNNLITIESYKIVSDAIGKRLEGLEQEHGRNESLVSEQLQKIKDIAHVLDVSSEQEQERAYSFGKNELLGWSIQIDNTMSRIEGRSRQDYYGAFPDINRNEFVHEHVTTIKCGF